jgi:signal transduction histidine kinase
MVIASGTVVMIVLSELATGGSFEEILFPLVVSSSVGASVGSLVGIIHDEVIVTNDELEAEIEQTRLLNQRLTVFNRVLRHNVRNTLTVALGLINLVIERLEESDTKEKLLRSRRALESLHSTTEKALDIDHLQARDTEMVEMNVTTLIEQAREQAETQAPAASVRADLPTDLTVRSHPLLPVAIDEGIQNAIKHNEPDELTIEISVEPQVDWVRITITDDGSGIPTGEAKSLALDEETPLQHGSGVGLWLIKWIVEESNGSFAVRSPDSGGTTLQLDVPAL